MQIVKPNLFEHLYELLRVCVHICVFVNEQKRYQQHVLMHVIKQMAKHIVCLKKGLSNIFAQVNFMLFIVKINRVYVMFYYSLYVYPSIYLN